MAKFSRLVVLNTMLDVGLVPLFYHGDIEIATKIIQACLEGGARCLEFTNRGDGAHLVFEQLVSCFKDDPRLFLGAGTVIDAGTAILYMQLGANFIVGPTLDEEIAYACNRRKVAYIPGCGNVNDISRAETLGVEICKFFPGDSMGGPNFVKSISGPMPWSNLMPTGGVAFREENIREWFLAGVACVGIGSNLITKEAVANGNFEDITIKIKQVLSWISSARQERASNKK